MPTEPGDYEIRYVLYQGRTTLTSTPISITEAQVSVAAPETAEMGSTIKIEWEGPNSNNDFIAVFPVGDEDAKYTARTYTRHGSPLKLLMPNKPGDYEIRYVLYQGRTELASTPISITEAQVSVSAPDTAELGSTIKVDWEGPDAGNDYIAVFPLGDEDAKYTARTYTRNGSPLKLLMPNKPGDYEIRYVLYQGRVELASTPISITEAQVSASQKLKSASPRRKPLQSDQPSTSNGKDRMPETITSRSTLWAMRTRNTPRERIRAEATRSSSRCREKRENMKSAMSSLKGDCPSPPRRSWSWSRRPSPLRNKNR